MALAGSDPNDVAFNVYRSSAKLNSSPVTGSTNYFDSGAPDSADCTVRPVVNGAEQGPSQRTGSRSASLRSPAPTRAPRAPPRSGPPSS